MVLNGIEWYMLLVYSRVLHGKGWAPAHAPIPGSQNNGGYHSAACSTLFKNRIIMERAHWLYSIEK